MTKKKSGTQKDEGNNSTDRRSLISLRAGLLLLIGFICGIVSGLLTFAATHNLAFAALAGLAACGTGITFFNTLIDV